MRNMVGAGVPERVAMTVSGHRSRSIFDRCDTAAQRDLREATQKTQAHLQATTTKPQMTRLRDAVSGGPGGVLRQWRGLACLPRKHEAPETFLVSGASCGCGGRI